MSELSEAYQKYSDKLDHILRNPTDTEIAALLPVDHPLPLKRMTVGQYLDFCQDIWYSKQKREIIVLLAKAENKHPLVLAPTNKHGQPIGNFPKDIPTQAEFDKYHTEPQGYGDEGDWLIVSKSVSQKQAFQKILAVLNEWGVSEDVMPKTADDLGSYDIGWGYDYDSYHYSEGGYWICSDTNRVSKRWEAWGVATQ